jgi:hypothetical protein
MDQYEYKYKQEHLKYIFEQQHEVQVSQDLKMYADLSMHEFNQFKDHIGNPKLVFEAGAGVGRGSVFLNHLLTDDSVEYILADRTGWQWNKAPNCDPENEDFYNDLALTADFCKLNGLKKFRTFDTESDDWDALPEVDLIFSLCAFGMHVSIERYIDRLISIAKPTGTMIFGTRHENYGPDIFKDRFEQVIFIPGPKHQPWKIDTKVGEIFFPQEDWLILKNPLK